LVKALSTAYPHVEIETQFETDGALRGDASDLMEIFGNVLENACKYCRSRVLLRVCLGKPMPSQQFAVCVVVADDGPGIMQNQRQQVLLRGQRADSQAPGQGIGLSVAAELVEVYQGELLIDDSELGGACISVTLPGFESVAAGA
jgi:two-component system sensor histidine kinase PhoQ